MAEYIFLGITFAFAAVVQPGPLMTYLISRSILKGWKHTLPAAFAPIISDGPIIIVTLFLLGNMPKIFLSILQTLGGFFLLFLAYNTYKSWKYFFVKNEEAVSSNQTLFKAVTVNLLNPNPYLGWSLVMGPLLLKGWFESPEYAIALIISFYTTMILGLMIMLFAISTTAEKFGGRTNRILIGISVIVLLAFGIYSILIGIKDLLIFD